MWRIGTNSSYGCEIYEVWNLRFNMATAPREHTHHAYSLEALQIKTYPCANSVDPDETASS